MTVNINLSRLEVFNSVPATYGQPEDCEEVTASTTVTVTTIAATGLNQVWEIDPDRDVWVAFGKTPDATVPRKRRFLRAGMPRNFAVGVVGEKISVLAAS